MLDKYAVSVHCRNLRDFLQMHVCKVSMYVCMHMCLCIYLCVCVYVCVLCMYVRVCVCMCVFVYLCMCLCIYVCMYAVISK